ncbi:hypothetical protein NVSP9465_03220 [Novosphingobium sp. CECT 9465]|nr:hypothetical protein NVSP9465_03220 [Novosphingobium sp. CECT 9465]
MGTGTGRDTSKDTNKGGPVFWQGLREAWLAFKTRFCGRDATCFKGI